MQSEITCSFFGHRNAILTESEYNTLIQYLESLITKCDSIVFLFESRSDFNTICHQIVTELKVKYPHIIRRSYTCRSESSILENERERWEKILSSIEGRDVHLLGVEEELEHSKKYVSGRASYIIRNQAIIDASDICIFYYDDTYKPATRKRSNNSISEYQPNSGTALSYKYALSKKKTIINIKNIKSK